MRNQNLSHLSALPLVGSLCIKAPCKFSELKGDLELPNYGTSLSLVIALERIMSHRSLCWKIMKLWKIRIVHRNLMYLSYSLEMGVNSI